jgi:AcrR family transcriptional regulator
MKPVRSISLNERKKARNKLALLDAALELTRRRPLSEITVQELCDITEISKSAFFNYFSLKVDLIVFYCRLWSVEAVWTAQHEYGASPGLRQIEAVFDWSGKIFEEHPRLVGEIIALRALQHASFAQLLEDSVVLVGPAERALRFHGKEGIESIPEGNLSRIIRTNLQAAVVQGDLPKKANFDEATVALASVFYGVPLMLCHQIPRCYAKEYSKQLKPILRALRQDGKGRRCIQRG